MDIPEYIPSHLWFTYSSGTVLETTAEEQKAKHLRRDWHTLTKEAIVVERHRTRWDASNFSHGREPDVIDTYNRVIKDNKQAERRARNMLLVEQSLQRKTERIEKKLQRKLYLRARIEAVQGRINATEYEDLPVEKHSISEEVYNKLKSHLGQLNEQDEAVWELNEQLSTLTTQNENLKNHVSEAEQAKEEGIQTLQQVQTASIDAIKAISGQISEISSSFEINNTVETVEIGHEDPSNVLVVLQRHQVAATTAIKALSQRLLKTVSSLQASQSENNGLKIKIDELNNKVGQQAVANEKLESSNNNSTATINTLQQELTQVNSSFQTLKDANSQWVSQITSLRGQVGTYKDEIERMDQVAADSGWVLSETQRDLRLLRSGHRDYRNMSERQERESRARLATARGECVVWKSKFPVSQLSNAAKTSRLVASQQRVQAIESQLDHVGQQLTAAIEANEGLRSQIDIEHQHVQRSDEAARIQFEQISGLKATIRNQEEIEDMYEEQVRGLYTEIQEERRIYEEQRKVGLQSEEEAAIAYKEKLDAMDARIRNHKEVEDMCEEQVQGLYAEIQRMYDDQRMIRSQSEEAAIVYREKLDAMDARIRNQDEVEDMCEEQVQGLHAEIQRMYDHPRKLTERHLEETQTSHEEAQQLRRKIDKGKSQFQQVNDKAETEKKQILTSAAEMERRLLGTISHLHTRLYALTNDMIRIHILSDIDVVHFLRPLVPLPPLSDDGILELANAHPHNEVKLLELANLEDVDWLPKQYHIKPESKYPPLVFAWINAWIMTEDPPEVFKEYLDRYVDDNDEVDVQDMLVAMLNEEPDDVKLAMVKIGGVNGRGTVLYRYLDEIGWRVGDRFVRVDKTAIEIDRDIVGFGTGWWCNVNGRIYRFDRVMKYMVDRDKLIG